MINLKLKEYLKEKKISIQWLHEVTGIRYATLYNMIHKKHKSINLKYLYSIMDALNVRDMSLIFEKQAKERKS
ncbi:hypothetical protein CIL05_07190 [Virgibacillus profundi]|uniref:HTH cro/C1-type domain-containing protein n=1 Tax=Virgibacillus profundi TaxID=2024555 RepID=A0A2A2IGI6_9BACI|nr:hypothetical protein CIL05_07190 [Virgibacillus profundi]PXY54417.1 hypothetical protein CIT14_07275 [Virgibacillus profundi]